MSSDATNSPFNATKVLVAEDNPVVRKGLVNFLEKWGYEPIEAENGDTAWSILEQDGSIRLAIVDWNLPGLSGMQVCQRLRIKSSDAYVYTVMFSSRKSKEEQILALDGGADDYLVKPCKPSELRARLGVGRRIIESAFLAATAATSQEATASKPDSEEKEEEVILDNPADTKEDND